MGPKHSHDGGTESTISLNPSEKRRLTAFLESTGSHSKFNRQVMQRLWKDLLVPDLLNSYADFLMKQDVSRKSYIGLEEFVLIYSTLVRGDPDERVDLLGRVIGTRQNSSGQKVLSYTRLCKYLSDLLESYFLIMRHRNDCDYKSWTHLKHPERSNIEHVMSGLTSDLPHKNDEVELPSLGRWLHYTAVLSVLHSHVLGSLYNLDPDVKASIIPHATFPSSKTPTFLDLSQVFYLNSFLPSDNKSKWRFLFSTSTHGESFSKFVGCLSNEGPVLLIMESDDKHIFGGFASENLAPGPRWVGSGDSFLFQLRPKVEMYSSTSYNDHYVYVNMNQSSLPNGLGMGGQYNYWGLWIDSHFGVGECSESCTTFKNYKMLASKKKFRIYKLEVWGVGERPLTAAEKGERTTGQSSILDKDAAATHILEMAGRKVYSKGLRDEEPQD